MKAIHKKLDDGSFPVRLVYMDTKTPQMELAHHLHDWHEIIYVYGGNGTMLVNHNLYEMKAGDLFLVPGNTVHRAFPDEHTPVTSSALFFSPALIGTPMDWGQQGSILRCIETARRDKHYRFELAQHAQQRIAELISAIHNELRSQAPCYQTAVQIRIWELLLLLSRDCKPARNTIPGDTQPGPAWMRETLQYIDANLTDNRLTLSFLSKQASITASHFSRVFKHTTSMNVTDYVVVKRIMLAKELLTNTDESISVISERCGMESESYFYRKFKHITGWTPSAYRKATT